ncbi:hypothetical protein WJX74_009572 [Apatococcus lobatus]|uniref:Sulfhydryl oxidase n=1 Tax=Apatococcus lobatus TaxID=904363 RepID=A0AAW1R0F1_9CHLO
MGVNADKWGPGAWRFLHYATLAFPDNPTKGQRKAYAALFHLLPRVLPCSVCRKHLRKSYQASPPVLQSRPQMIRWMEDVHTAINVRLRKKVKRVPVQGRIEAFRKGWRAGLRDLAFSMAFNAPRVTLSNDIVHFLAACRRVAGANSLPAVTHLKTKAGLLNTLSAFFRVSKTSVQAKYRPWLSQKSLVSSNRVWPFTRNRPASASSTRTSSRPSRRRVLHLKIGL